jgi:hypothetical protein
MMTVAGVHGSSLNEAPPFTVSSLDLNKLTGKL